MSEKRVWGMFAVDRGTLQALWGLLDQLGFDGSGGDVLSQFYRRCERTFMGAGTAERLPEVVYVKE